MSKPVSRAFVVPTSAPLEDGRLVVVPDEAEEWIGRMLTVLLTVGGTLTIETERSRVGGLGDEPIAVTTGLLARWTARAPLVELAEPGPGEGDAAPGE